MIENARIFALMNVAAADATIAGWAIKRQYPLWRPVAAIRQSGKDGDRIGSRCCNTPAIPTTFGPLP